MAPARSVPRGGFFVTGTDTGVGKTRVSCALVRALAGRGLRAVGMKPVAAGAERRGDRWINEDVAALQAASTVTAPVELVNPYCFAPPIAPHIAAAEAGETIDIELVAARFAGLLQLADAVVVEGAGGFLVPLGADADMGTLAQRLGLPVIMVVGMRLGCINHALLTEEAVRSRGLELAGWVANHIDPRMARADENVEALAARLAAPLVARIAYGAEAADIAATLDAGTLLARLNRLR